jgi:hypothetical protein
MPCSPAESAAQALAALDAALARAGRAFAGGDLEATAAEVDLADRLLAAPALTTGGGAAVDAGKLAAVRHRHADLLTAVVGERDRLTHELSRLRASQRAMRSYRRRQPTDAGRSA